MFFATTGLYSRGGGGTPSSNSVGFYLSPEDICLFIEVGENHPSVMYSLMNKKKERVEGRGTFYVFFFLPVGVHTASARFAP